MAEIRKELKKISEELVTISQRLEFLMAETHRRKPIRKAPPRPEAKVSKEQISDYFMSHPTASNQDAAIYFGVNSRAISIAFRGPRI